MPTHKKLQTTGGEGKKVLSSVLFLFQAFIYAYFIKYVDRSNTVLVFTFFITLFLFYFFVLLKPTFFCFKTLIAASVLFRLVMLVDIPWLSDDFYRFIWDGYLSSNGMNPYLYIPAELIATNFKAPFFIDLMNSPSFYTVYPPFDQLVFFLSSGIGNGNVFWSSFIMKVFMILAELGSIYLLIVLLRNLNLPKQNVLLYALNPLVIIEFVGNLHSEGFMIFFLLLSIWFMNKKRLVYSSIAFAMSICSKLLPILLLPLLVWRIGWKKTILFSSGTMLIVLLSFLPFWDTDLFQNIFKSLRLYFNYLEFNASLYYLFKWIYWHEWKGALILLKALFLLTYLVIWLRNRRLKNSFSSFFLGALFVFFAYLLTSQSIHPWYICVPLLLSVFTPYKFPAVWSFLAVFTYITYQYDPMRQTYWIVWVEYSLLAVYVIVEYSEKVLKRVK